MFTHIRAALRHGLVRALLLSLATLVVPITGAFLLPAGREDYEALLWLTALIPAFLLSYYRGWRGVATSLAAGMASLSVTYAITQTAGRQIPDLLFPVVVVYLVISLMVGWLADRLHKDVTRERIEGAAFSDPVTGLPNRKHAELHLEIELNAAQRGRSLTVVLLDIDHFANYNTRHGKLAGDEALRVISTAIKNSTRRVNLAARLGGDEFMCVLGGSDEDGALVFMGRLQETLRVTAVQVPLPTLSAGIASYRPGMKTGQDLSDAALEALQRAQKDGPGRVRVYGRELHKPVEVPVMAGAAVAEPAHQAPCRKVGAWDGRRWWSWKRHRSAPCWLGT
jgi:diguanylate cyclase (GGDEF)-like protein